jgi:hypothetical protein
MPEISAWPFCISPPPKSAKHKKNSNRRKKLFGSMKSPKIGEFRFCWLNQVFMPCSLIIHTPGSGERISLIRWTGLEVKACNEYS